jgi:hypothetical protein
MTDTSHKRFHKIACRRFYDSSRYQPQDTKKILTIIASNYATD